MTLQPSIKCPYRHRCGYISGDQCGRHQVPVEFDERCRKACPVFKEVEQ